MFHSRLPFFHPLILLPPPPHTQEMFNISTFAAHQSCLSGPNHSKTKWLLRREYICQAKLQGKTLLFRYKFNTAGDAVLSTASRSFVFVCYCDTVDEVISFLYGDRWEFDPSAPERPADGPRSIPLSRLTWPSR